jgi:flagellar hook assembly protein FlgD
VFTANEAGARQFELVIEPGTASRAVIGNVMVSGSSRDPQAPISIQYSLSAAATVTSRILSVSGTEVFSMSRGRAENAGVNTVIWNKRMTDGTAVAPGNYLVEIIAETADGQRVRVTRPVVVTR